MMFVMDTHESKRFQMGRCPTCRAGVTEVHTEAIHEEWSGSYLTGAKQIVGAEYEITRTCENGHTWSQRDWRSFVPPREREVSVEAEGKPYVGPVVVKYARHFMDYEDAYDTFEEAWETHSWSSDMGEEYTIHYAKPDGTVMWEMPNPFDGWIRRSPDAPPLPDRDEDDE